MDMTAHTAATVINNAKANGHTVMIEVRVPRTANIDRVTGNPISVNTKGVNIKVDGKVRSFAISRIVSITANTNDDTALPTGSPADVAPYFGLTAKELRVKLRAMNMNVGKGHRYALDTDAVRAVAAHLAAN